MLPLGTRQTLPDRYSGRSDNIVGKLKELQRCPTVGALCNTCDPLLNSWSGIVPYVPNGGIDLQLLFHVAVTATSHYTIGHLTKDIFSKCIGSLLFETYSSNCKISLFCTSMWSDAVV